jgi:hypothetical protein
VKAAALSAALALTACVPASEPRPPAGAGGFNVTPSAAGRGEPFAQGAWTITVEKLVVQASVGAMRVLNGDDGYYGGGGAEWIFEVRAAPVIFAPGAPIGPARVQASLHGQYLSHDTHRGDDHMTFVGVSAEDVQRMYERADVPPSYLTSSQYYDYAYGPSVLLRMRGARDDGERVVVDLTIVTQSSIGSGFVDTGKSLNGGYFGSGAVEVEIRANSLNVGIMDVAPELLFDETFPFQVIADADADRSGTVTSVELQAVQAVVKSPKGMPAPPSSPSPSSASGYTQSLLDTLSNRLVGLCFRVHS